MFEDEEFIDFPELLNRYEEMERNETVYFFDVEEFETLAGFLFDTGQTSKALRLVQQGLHQHPSAVELLIKKTKLLTAVNKLKEADLEIEKLESIIPGSFELIMARANLFSRRSQHKKAIKLFREALALADFPDEVWPLLAMEYQFTGNYTLALKYLKLTLEVNPTDEVAIYNSALCFEMLNNNGAALDFFQKFVDQNPYNEIAWYQLGVFQFRSKFENEAIKSLDYAILIDEYFSAAYFEKARILEEMSQFGKAIAVYQENMSLEGYTGYGFYRIGLCHLKMHELQKAEKSFLQAINEDEELDEAYYEMALIQDETNRASEAIHTINKAVSLDPENWDYLFTSAEIHKRNGRLDEAEVIYQDLIEMGYIDPDIFINFGELLFDLCEFKEGMDLLYQGVQLNPDSAEMHYRLAGYLYTLQEGDEADIYFKKALELDSERRIHFFALFPKLRENNQVLKLVGQHLDS